MKFNIFILINTIYMENEVKDKLKIKRLIIEKIIFNNLTNFKI